MMNNKQFSLMVLGVIVAAVLMIYWGKELSVSTKVNATAPSQNEARPAAEQGSIVLLENALEAKLKEKLQLMKDVGRAEVFVSLSSGLVREYAHNENITKRTQSQTDKSGGASEITEETSSHQLVLPNGSSQPVIVMEQKPVIDGVLVIAEGAGDPQLKAQIQTAVQALLNLPAEKVSVEVMGVNAVYERSAATYAPEYDF
ncbi:MAG: stage III sporulation protein AH [Peptococcaceae bacterium]|jgi:stage III sporulation protein AG|nr:stage III sporulation protein AH [Peptococcaceae bacterium]